MFFFSRDFNFVVVVVVVVVLLLLLMMMFWNSEMSSTHCFLRIEDKNALCLNRCNTRTVHAIDFLFSTRHTTPFQYVKLYFGVLHKLCADVTRSDSP